MGTAFLMGQGGGSVKEFFGDGSDGDFNSTGNVTLPSILNGEAVVKQYNNFVLNAGHTLTVSQPCMGLVIYVNGDVQIDGTIDMSKKAGLGAPTYFPIPLTKQNSDGSKKLAYNALPANIYDLLKGGAGGNGGAAGNSYTMEGYTGYGGAGGNGGAGRILAGGFGGGGGGGTIHNVPGVKGGDIENPYIGNGFINPTVTQSATSITFRGIPGINGSGASSSVIIAQASVEIHKVGRCLGGGGGGCGASYNAYLQQPGHGEYAGGAVIIIAKGNVIIGNTGKILANGGNGGRGSDGVGYTGCSGGGGGGGSGGGVVAIFYKGNYINNGAIQVNGGSGGSGGGAGGTSATAGSSGSSGSAGTIYIQQI